MKQEQVSQKNNVQYKNINTIATIHKSKKGYTPGGQVFRLAHLGKKHVS